MSWRDDLPARNRYGLVIPPTPATSPRRIIVARERGTDFPTRHHLYWPKKAFQAAGALACEFREHPFNQVTLPQFQHTEYHNRYDEPVVHKYPAKLIPDEEVMSTFLDEATVLEHLGVSMRALDMIDEAIYEGRVKHMNQVIEHKEAHLAKIGRFVARLSTAELLHGENYLSAIESAQALLRAA